MFNHGIIKRKKIQDRIACLGRRSPSEASQMERRSRTGRRCCHCGRKRRAVERNREERGEEREEKKKGLFIVETRMTVLPPTMMLTPPLSPTGNGPSTCQFIRERGILCGIALRRLTIRAPFRFSPSDGQDRFDWYGVTKAFLRQAERRRRCTKRRS